MGWSLLARVVAVSGACMAAVAGCATLAGVNDGNDGPRANDGGGGLLGDGGGVVGDGGSTAADALASCKPGNAAESTSRLHATKVDPSAPVDVNGDAAEWACVDRLDVSTGGRAIGAAAGHDVAEVAMQWDAQHLYFLARVTTDSPGGTAPRTTNFLNDSMHLFLAAPAPQPNAGYRAGDHQLVFDSMNLVADYVGGITQPGTNGITSTTGPARDQNGALTFVVEARVDAAIVGRPGGLAAGDVVRVNFQINDNAATAYRMWFWEAAVCQGFGTCNKSGASEPYCDPHCSGEVTLR